MAPLRRREAVLGLVVGLVVLAGAVAGVGVSKDARQDQARATASGDLAVAAGQVQADLTSVVDDARRLAARISASGTFVPALAVATSPVAAGAGFARAAQRPLDVEGGVALAPGALDADRAALDLARDTATPRALPPLPLADGGERPFIAAPSYRASASGLPPDAATTDERRADLLGYVLVGVDVDAIATRAARNGAPVVVGSAAAETVAPEASAASTASLTVAGQTWTVATPPAHASGLSGGEVIVLVLGLLFAVGAWLTGAAIGKRQRVLLAEADAARLRLRLLTSLAPLLQETLDLGLVLPEIATRLRDELDLAGIGFAVPAGRGAFRDLYVLGTVDAVDPRPDLKPSLAAGESVAIVMHRGGRNVAMLRVKPRRALSVDEVEALEGAAELATAAIVSGQLFEQQDEAMRQLREVDEMKTSFLSTASHELRTPVTAIKGFATLLDGSWSAGTDEDQRIYAERILANAKSLDALVQELLDFSRLERGRLLARAQPVDLSAVVSDVLERLSVLFTDHVLAKELAPTPLVLADPGGLERIITNLVSNAAHYSPPTTTVTVRTAPCDGGAELIVDDEGPGVPEGERDKVFARFFRGTGDAVVRTRGTGIGLAVVKEYVDQLGGAVSVASAPGGGARFRVWLAGADPIEEEAT